MKRVIFVASSALVAFGSLGVLNGQQAAEIARTPHNLSRSGPGSVKSTSEGEVCIFCHTPHKTGGQKALWNRRDTGAIYNTYKSSTLKATPGQPTGVSRMCLSCHDGTVALGNVVSRSRDIDTAGGGRMPPGSRGHVGTDLSSHHPISFSYAVSQSRGSELVGNPSSGKQSLLDRAGEVQCTSCHDPHSNANGGFLRLPAARSQLCTGCHAPAGWERSAHATAPNRWTHDDDRDPTKKKTETVAESGCQSCHKTHAAPGKERLTRHANHSDSCDQCHDGTVAGKNVRADGLKWSAHGGNKRGKGHDGAEIRDGRATHIECGDCHASHRAGATTGTDALPAALVGVKGLNLQGSPVSSASAEYEVCLGCHADDASTSRLRIPRVIEQPNHRLRFLTQNPSYHPVAAPGVNSSVPSLKPPYTPASTIRCTSCHASDASPAAGGNGPAGPHGSQWEPILERQYVTADKTAESPAAYALCYKCHERASILANQSFRGHSKHVADERTPCSVCHDSHGVTASLGATTQHNAKLINFDTRSVKPNSKGVLEYTNVGTFRSECSLTCHGEDHDRKRY